MLESVLAGDTNSDTHRDRQIIGILGGSVTADVCMVETVAKYKAHALSTGGVSRFLPHGNMGLLWPCTSLFQEKPGT